MKSRLPLINCFICLFFSFLCSPQHSRFDKKNDKILDYQVFTSHQSSYSSKQEKKNAVDILEKVKENIPKNYVLLPYIQQFLYQYQMYDENDHLSTNELALIDVYFDNNDLEEDGTRKEIYGIVRNYGYTVKNTKKNKIYSFKHDIEKDFIFNTTNVLHNSSGYDMKIDSLCEYRGKYVYKISFTNLYPSSENVEFYYSNPNVKCGAGEIYIDKESYAVLKYENCVYRDVATSENLPYLLKFDHKIKETYNEINGKYFIDSIKITDKIIGYPKNKRDTKLETSYRVYNISSQNIQTIRVERINKQFPDYHSKLKLKSNPKFIEDYNHIQNEESYKFENCGCE